MPKCKSNIPDSNEECGLEIKWKYPYMQVPAGEKNRPLNLDGSPHWGTCRANPDSHPPMDMSRPDTPIEKFESAQKWQDTPKVNLMEKAREEGISYEEAKRIYQISEPEFETANARLDYERTFKLIEITISKTRKVNEKTIPHLPQYENVSYLIAPKFQCELGADIGRIAREKFAEISLAIAKEIEQDIIRFSGLKDESK